MKILRTAGRRAAETQAAIAALTDRRNAGYERVLPQARRIVDQVRRGGDAALLRLRAKLDGIPSQTPLRISESEMRAAWEATPAPLRAAMRTAAKNIRKFAERQRPKDFDLRPAPGVRTGQRVIPLASVGCYVPSGRYPLPSTLLMTVIPAQIAGVERIVVVSPKPATETLAAAAMLGVTEFYRIGGAQAIAALAFGTEGLPRVEKMVGPGNAWVTAAKKLVAFDCGVDMLAGPTEIVVTSETGDAASIAADLVAQAEHDPEAVAILITSRADLAKAVVAEVKGRFRGNAIATAALTNHGLAVVTRSAEEARELTNRIAPEHLTVDSAADLAWVRNAGSVFIGRWSAQPLGDYVSGPNHTLPTSGLARVRGGLSVLDFVKLVTVQEYSEEGVRRLGPAAIRLANAEGLKGHAEAIRARMKKRSGDE
ncbi:MAG TPA: histidinol dehydrogenase [Acidobacteriaceae bacterium]|nr:histidinol dehydrogenase [Acidobacteriaceae bacterium]